MTVNFDVLGAAASPAGARLDRRDAEARQDRWMQQLERAAFDAVAKPDTPHEKRGVSADAAPAAADAPGAGALLKPVAGGAHQVRAASAAMAPAAAGARPAAAGPQAADAPAAQAGAPAGAARARAADGASAPAQGAQPDSAAASQGPLPALPAQQRAAAPQGELNALAALAGATPAVFAVNTYALAAGVVAASALRPGAPGVPGVPGAATALPPASMAAGAAPALGTGPSAAQAEAEGAPAPSEEQAEAGHGAPEQHAAGEAEQYTKSLLHVYRDNQGVHAWLRDAALDGGQVRAVAQAMAGELARSGTPLAALSINGKKIVAGPGLADEGDHSEAAPDGARATISSARHGGLPAVQGAL